MVKANAYGHTFTYDAAGNRTLKNIDSARTTTTYDAANQLDTSVDSTGTTTYTFDANGNQRLVHAPNGDRTTNTWDYENKNTKVELPDTTIATYTYNAVGQRTSKEVDGSETKFIWDEENILLETNAANVTQVTKTLEPQLYGNLISDRTAGTTRYYHFDALGSTSNLTNSAETVTDTWIYDAWGNIVPHTGITETPNLWVGEIGYYYDAETGQYSVRARVYDPVIGRWKSVDPLGFLDGSNRYLIVLNNVVLVADPSGLATAVIDADAFIPWDWVSIPPVGWVGLRRPLWVTSEVKGDNRNPSQIPLRAKSKV